MQEIQEKIVVQGSRIEYAIYCDWCCGHGFEADNYGDVVDCHSAMVRGSSFSK